VGFGVGFLLGSLSLGLASLMIAISPTPTMPVTPAPTPSFASVSQEEENQSKLLNTQQVPRPQRQCLSLKGALQVINYPASVAVLVTMLFFGLASGVVPTALHWYFMELGASRCMLGASMSSALICIPLVFLLSGWLWKRCGSHYIFIIGLLFCSIRFLGYSLVEEPVFLVAIEMLEPVCSTWMLLTASAHIQRHLAASSRINAFECSLQANSWALIIIFHYCFGRGVGGFLAAVAAHHFGVTDVFIAAAVITLMSAAVWFTCLHAPTTCCAKRSEQSKKKDGSPSRRGGKAAQDRTGDSYTQLQDLKSAGSAA